MLTRVLMNRLLPAWSEWFLLFPLWFTVSLLLFTDHTLLVAWTLSMPIAVMLGVLLQQLRPMRKVWQSLLISLAGAAAMGFGWPGDVWAQLAGSLLIAVFLYRGLQYGLRDWHELLHPNLGWISLLLFFIGHFFYQRAVVLEPFANAFSLTGIGALAIVLFITNQSHLQASSLTREEEDAAAVRPLLRTSRLYLIVLFALILAISLFDTIWHALTEGLKSLVDALLSWFDREAIDEVPPPASEPPPQPDLFPMTPSEPSWFAKLMEWIFGWLAYGITIVAALVVLYLLFKGLRRLLQGLQTLLGRTNEPSDPTGYFDEKESLLAKAAKENNQRWSQIWQRITYREPKWSDMKDNRERARFLFRHWVKRMRDRGYAWQPQHAPEELVQDALSWQKQHAKGDVPVSTYHKARYGPPDSKPTDREIMVLKDRLEK